MDPRTFLDVAAELAVGTREADWRSAISRAYYSAYHVAGALLRATGFDVPVGAGAHAYLWLRLSNATDTQVCKVGRSLGNLRSFRNVADYDLGRPIHESDADTYLQIAIEGIRILDDLAVTPTILAEVVDAIRVYERTVLREVTWRGPGDEGGTP